MWGIAFITGSNTTGVYAGFSDNTFYQFYCNNNGNTFSMSYAAASGVSIS